MPSSWTLAEPSAYRAPEHVGRPLVETCRDERTRRGDGRHRVPLLRVRPHDTTCGCDESLEEQPALDVVRVIGIPDRIGGRIGAWDVSLERAAQAAGESRGLRP